MPGTRAGGLKAAKTTRARYGKKAAQRWGAKGGNPYLKKGYKYGVSSSPL